MRMYPVLKLSSEEETLVLNKISQLRVELEYLIQINNETLIDYSNPVIAENFIESIGELYNLNIISYGK
ncbi:MAG: hypothetical protein HeimC3_40160 [Candidatus Heimdallarchaeota archaeon LC_3]|nr:MAG: hypothetical protein HeimC3_40160 [Candidatus Heimdallarchaeota archaeon LC_3]